MRRSIAVALLWIAVLALPAAGAAERAPADLVLVQQGELPIILTAPHGGREAIPGIEPRWDRAQDEAYRKWGGFQRGTRYRHKPVLDKSASDAARAIAAFYEAYLK
jgi:hypothetical protein